MIKNFLPVVFLFLMGSLSAQNFVVSKINSSHLAGIKTDADTVKILAIMVSFQEDRDGTTFGNGKFESLYSTAYGSTILDPLPHDRQYFEDHLLFAQNYFNKVSGGNLFINYHVLPDTFSVSQTMRNYAPEPNSDDFTSLGNFATEAWTIAVQMYPELNFEEYDLFTIFHAGAGRDISLPGSIGNERDLPSVYMSLNSLREIFGDEFEGIPVPGGNFKIPNTLILPETESRELSTVNGTVLFQISINGLITASIGSFLGVPDLFDTETGLSAIGRFGLMDGQGIFAYGGTYPPEPSPWTKIRLGWVTPVTVNLENTELSVITKEAAGINDTVILKIPINSSEYFLVENRIRDANNDGSTVTYKSSGTIKTKTFFGDSAGYRSFDIESLEGVILDVDEFDWAIPGNGIVIWHIDENIISENIVQNRINADKNNRGIDIEEADGIQDIGEKFISVFGDEVIGEGTDEDLWHADNPGRFFENRFAKDTRPDSRTNSGANSLITLKDFSEINNRMNFKVEFGDSIVKPLFQTRFSQSLSDLNLIEDGSQVKFAMLKGSTLFITDGISILDSVEDFSSSGKTASIMDNQAAYIIGLSSNKINYWLNDGSGFSSGGFNISSLHSTPPTIRENLGADLEVLLGTEGGIVYIYDLVSIINDSPILKDSLVTNLSMPIKKISCSSSDIAVIDENNLFLNNTIVYSNESEEFFDLVTTISKDGNFVSVIASSTGKIYVFLDDRMLSSFQAPQISGNISLADIKNNGENYILISGGNELYAYNLSGALADNLPINDPVNRGFAGTFLTADFEGDDKSEVISFTMDGRIFAIDGGTGNFVTGFPISSGSGVALSAVLYNSSGKTNLAVLSNHNNFSAWSISSVEGELQWSEVNGNSQNTSFVDAASTSNVINEFFPQNRAYNYPNPVYNAETNIRYFVSEDSKINIKIFDLAGDYVAELNDDARGGMDNETIWSVGDIQSGVYFARIEAVSNSGKSEFAIIKIAVVK